MNPIIYIFLPGGGFALGNFVFDMPWEPTKYGAVVSVDLTKEAIVPKVEYVRIDNEFAPHIINDKDVPKEFRFDYLNKQLVKEDNSEGYHAEINRCYKQYRKANHKDIAKKMLAHPAVIGGIVKDFIKRRV